MADAQYDAIIVGGGTKGLVLGCYLAEYGGMQTAIFEKRHELGGCWASEEFIPGFIGDSHATDIGRGYLWPLSEDFPDLKEKGGEWVAYKVAAGAIFREDDTCITIYHRLDDPDQEKTAGEISKFSPADGEAWLDLWKTYNEVIRPAVARWSHNLPAPPDQPLDVLEAAFMQAAKRMGGDASWLVKSPLDLFREVFENDAVVAALLRIVHSYAGTPPDMAAAGPFELFMALPELVNFGCAKGGTHSYAHAAFKVYTDRGGLSFANQAVDKILVENGRAVGVRLENGTEVRATKLVATDLDPYTVFFRLLSDVQVSPRLLRKIKHLSRKHITITWYPWAVEELPDYKAAGFCKDINDSGWTALISKDPEELVRIHARKVLREKHYPENSLVVWAHTIVDPTRAPEGKHSIGTEDFAVPPASVLTEKEWRSWKKEHAERVMQILKQHTTNMNWDKVIGYAPWSPLEATNVGQTGPEGCWATIDHIPSQVGRFRPVPELAGHRTSIKGLYCTGAGWFPLSGGTCTNGYTCYKAICEDFGLRKPWEEKGRPF
ncbi:MAG: NAD(P)/FAD-dependent oxidoreductase [Clostridia bacterium]|nr:MAG: NAD(P)/FAD-dependent oxidoreductase [Clostridia bacterium]